MTPTIDLDYQTWVIEELTLRINGWRVMAVEARCQGLERKAEKLEIRAATCEEFRTFLLEQPVTEIRR